MDRSNLHRLTSYGDKCHRQLILANTVSQQFQYLGYHIAGIAALRDHALLHTYVALFLRSGFNAQYLE